MPQYQIVVSLPGRGLAVPNLKKKKKPKPTITTNFQPKCKVPNKAEPDTPEF